VEDLEADLARVFAGDREATARLVRAFVPVVQARAYAVLAARGGKAGHRDVRQEVEDAAQEVLYRLFEGGARRLRDWDRSKGLSLLNFVGLIAHREVGHILTSSARSPWTSVPTEDEALRRMAGATRPAERDAEARDAVDRLWARLKDELTPKGLLLFRALFLEERTVEEICAEQSMLPDAVYAWRSRLMKRARALASELGAGAEDVSGSAPSHANPEEKRTP
jgi:RNA polymerase sigma-70 factor (ECF subfamily)